MEGREKPHTKIKGDFYDWNYEASCMLTPVPELEVRKFQVLDFCCTECTIKLFELQHKNMY
jgi:hypothetical protein